MRENNCGLQGTLPIAIGFGAGDESRRPLGLAVVGGLILSVLGNGLNLIGVSSFWQLVVKGVVLLVAVMAYERGKVVKA